MTENRSVFICVACGALATEGSMKEPYCLVCFQKIWNNDYKAYNMHLAGVLREIEAKLVTERFEYIKKKISEVKRNG